MEKERQAKEMDFTKTTEKKSILQVFGSYVLWGIFPVFWKMMAELNSVYVLSSRIVWSAVFCFLLIVLTKRTEELKRVLADGKMRKTMMCSGIAIAVNWGVYIYAVNSGHILDASLAYYLNPLIVIALGFFLFQEKADEELLVALGLLLIL